MMTIETMGWEATKYEVVLNGDGRRMVGGYTKGPFGIDERRHSLWVLTHLPTGRAIASRTNREDMAWFADTLRGEVGDEKAWDFYDPSEMPDSVREAGKKLLTPDDLDPAVLHGADE